DAWLDAKPGRGCSGGVTERPPGGEQFRTENVSGQIAIAGVKPYRLSQLPHGIQAKKSVALHAPTALLAQSASQHVGDRIQIGRSVQSPPQHVVAGVHDDGQVFRTNDLPESVYELGAARAAGQNRDHAALFL